MNVSRGVHEEFNTTGAGNAGQSLNRRARRIPVVDGDLGFVLWLGVMLAKAGCAAVPAGDLKSALAMNEKLVDGLDLLVLNPQIQSATQLVSALHRCHFGLKVVALVAGNEATALPFVCSYLRKPSETERTAAPRIIHLIDDLLMVNEGVTPSPRRAAAARQRRYPLRIPVPGAGKPQDRAAGNAN